jgi:hypothetical protein
MIIDNFDKILNSNIFWNPEFFKNGEHCYCVSIMKRIKDKSEHELIKVGHNTVMDNMLIYKKEELTNKIDYIKTYCNTFNTRAYISLNPIRLSTLLKTFTIFCFNDLTIAYETPEMLNLLNTNEIFNSAAIRGEEIHYFLVDCDTLIPKEQNTVKQIINLGRKDNIILESIPTLNGVHYITTPFNISYYHDNLKTMTTISAHCVPNPRVLLYYNSNY